MKWTVKLKEKMQKNMTLDAAIKVVLFLLIIYLLSLTSHVWLSIIKTITRIIIPFIIGFIIAYLLHPIVHRFEKMGIGRKIVIPILFVILLGLLCTIVFTISPTVYNRVVGFINSMIQGVNSLFEFYRNASENAPLPLVQALVQQFNQLLNNSKTWLPNFSAVIPLIFNGFIAFLTNALFTIIITFYFLFDYERITDYIDRISEAFNPDFPKIFELVDSQIGSYLHGLLILMMIKFIEYSILYSLVGHRDWMIIALLTSIGLLIPYFGATVANLIGILTALSLPIGNVIVLILGILILSNFDAYIIGPLVHLKNSQIRPLWTLFSIFTGGILMGSLGVMISVPVFMIIKVLFTFYREKSNGLV